MSLSEMKKYLDVSTKKYINTVTQKRNLSVNGGGGGVVFIYS